MNIKKIIDKIAKKEGISRKQVLNEMQKAIDEGFTNPDPQIKAEWAKIPCKGSRPTPEELIEYEIRKLTGKTESKSQTRWCQ